MKPNLSKVVIISIFLLIGTFFSPFFLSFRLPVPSDTIVGLYHPFRDLYAKEYPRGIPFKNFLITDPVRQLIPWKKLTIENLSQGTLPIWNPYEMAGTPHLANVQSSVFYPLNILLAIEPFYFGWSIFIISQYFLAAFFLYLYLKNLKLDPKAIYIGILAFCFSGFFVAWMEWGNIIHTILWLPLILLSIDQLVVQNKNKKILIWSIVYCGSLIAAFFAGHLQTFFYLMLLSLSYSIFRILIFKRTKLLLALLGIYTVFLLVTLVQWLPTLQYILLSARELDQADWRKEGWFIPWGHLVQFIVPDYFGNPTTLNYWGIWNYAEFIGYVGIIPIFFAIYGIVFKRSKEVVFFAIAALVSLIFVVPNPLSQIPYQFHIPFLSTAQPTRLLSIVCFSLAILSSFGLQFYLDTLHKSHKSTLKHILAPIVFFGILFLIVGSVTVFGGIESSNMSVAKRNMVLQLTIISFTSIVLILLSRISNKRMRNFAVLILLIVASFDAIRFAQKFEPFVKPEYFFPNTKTIELIKRYGSQTRIASMDTRILPPNFPTYYKIQSIEGYDPLYLKRYGEFIAAMERGRPDISAPFGFNRIITPHNVSSPLFELLNVNLVLSLSDIENPKLKKVFQEGETRVYHNFTIPRVFFVKSILKAENKQEAMEMLYQKGFTPIEEAVVEGGEDITLSSSGVTHNDGVHIYDYKDNRVRMYTSNQEDRFLVFLDTYYPTWKVKIYKNNYENKKVFDEGQDAKVYITNYNFRGVVVPKGTHIVEFYNTLI